MAGHRVSRRRSALLVGLLSACALVAVLAGCSKDADSLDSGATATEVQRVIGGRIDPDVDHVTCPDDIERGTGESFTCTAVLAGGLGRVRLRVTQVDDGEVLRIGLIDAVVDRVDAARQLHRSLVASYHRTFTVDCGPAGPVVLAPKATFRCTAKDADGTRTVVATVVDPTGTLRFDLGRSS